MTEDKFDIQDSQYEFPYHYIPYLTQKGGISIHRQMSWGMDYLTYMSFILSKVRELKPDSLLDVGCGDGRFSNMVKDYVPNVVGIDLSEPAIRWAECFNPDLQFICGDVGDLEDRFDAIAVIEVLEHVPDEHMKTFIASLRSRMNPGGALFVTVPTVNLPLNKKHYRHYSLELLEETLSGQFVIEEHWWLYKQGMMERALQSSLCNPLFTTNYSRIRRFVWNLHKKYSFMGDKTSGRHLACIAKPVS